MKRGPHRERLTDAFAPVRVGFVALLIVSMSTTSFGQASAPQNPYSAEGEARDNGRTQSLSELRATAAALARTAHTAVELCTVAELYKLVGDTAARSYYEKAILADPDEPAYELLYGDYLRLYRGAGQRPLFPDAEKHLQGARAKLTSRTADRAKQLDWDSGTADRLRRSLTALYERDGLQLASRAGSTDGSTPAGSRPWLFLSPSIRFAQSTSDLDRASDVRDFTSAALFSASPSRLNRALTDPELAGLVRVVTPHEVGGTVRLRNGSAPVLDLSVSGRHSDNAQVTNFYRPNEFNGLRLTDFGAAIEKPFTIGASTDALVAFQVHRVNRDGLIEFLPDAAERVTQVAASGALSHYVGPDRVSFSYTYVRQRIDPDPAAMLSRDRELMGGTATYQIFRPLPGRNVNTGLGRRFEPRGIDLFAGALDDRERFPAQPADILVTRRDYFVGVAARGLGRFDATFQPTWYESRVSNDAAQHNSQFRFAGTIVARILDEERSAGIPPQRFAGLPVAFVQLVVPYHRDAALEGLDTFRSRRVGVELWVKFFTNDPIGVTTLAVVGYSRQQFPGVGKDIDLLSARFSIGF